jgi:hypothetical protein
MPIEIRRAYDNGGTLIDLEKTEFVYPDNDGSDPPVTTYTGVYSPHVRQQIGAGRQQCLELVLRSPRLYAACVRLYRSATRWEEGTDVLLVDAAQRLFQYLSRAVSRPIRFRASRERGCRDSPRIF